MRLCCARGAPRSGAEARGSPACCRQLCWPKTARPLGLLDPDSHVRQSGTSAGPRALEGGLERGGGGANREIQPCCRGFQTLPPARALGLPRPSEPARRYLSGLTVHAVTHAVTNPPRLAVVGIILPRSRSRAPAPPPLPPAPPRAPPRRRLVAACARPGARCPSAGGDLDSARPGAAPGPRRPPRARSTRAPAHGRAAHPHPPLLPLSGPRPATHLKPTPGPFLLLPE